MQHLADKLYQNLYFPTACQLHRKKKLPISSTNIKATIDKNTVKIPYTRQQIANFTGLRAETVIRTFA